LRASPLNWALAHKGIALKFARKFKCSSFVFTPIETGDAVYLLTAVSSDLFPKSLPLAKIKTLNQAEDWCSDRASDWNMDKCYVWSCRRLANSQVIGQVTLFPQENRLALAYWVNPEFWGQGLATQMCKALLSHVCSSGYQGNIWAGVHSWNSRSSSVLKKLGFEQIVSNSENTAEYSLEIVC
ncbi:GNAT family N-acetyltransferase, partial [Vibrio parahaemolyticus]|uniref:GNAT family N-acetyltransferase n=1 Tax=Vibrio parahaemolyticus TaxID=670 RepID=UPI002B4C00D2